MRDGGVYTPSRSSWKDTHWMRRVKGFCNRRVYSWPRKTSQTRVSARDTNFTAKRPASVITRGVTTRINLVIAMQHKNTDRSDNRFRISWWLSPLFRMVLIPKNKILFRISNFLVFEQFPAYFKFKLGRDAQRNSFHRNYFVQKELGSNCWEIIPILPNGPESQPIRIFLG